MFLIIFRAHMNTVTQYQSEHSLSSLNLKCLKISDNFILYDNKYVPLYRRADFLKVMFFIKDWCNDLTCYLNLDNFFVHIY